MKKLVSLLLALCLVFALGASAFAYHSPRGILSRPAA